MFASAEAAVASGRDDSVLLVRNFAFGVLADEVVSREIRSDGKVVPTHHPQAGYIDGHGVRLPQAALAPRGIVGGALNHGSPSGVGHLVGIDSARPAHGSHDIYLRKMFEGFGPIDRRHLWCEVKEPRGGREIGLAGVRRKLRTDLVLICIQPSDKPQLHSATPIPRALLVVGPYFAYARAEAFRDNRGKRLIA